MTLDPVNNVVPHFEGLLSENERLMKENEDLQNRVQKVQQIVLQFEAKERVATRLYHQLGVKAE